MFKKQDSGGEIKEAETIIGPSIKVKGNFNGQGDIVLEGTLEGSLKTQGNVFVGDQAKVSASIEAKNVNVGGEIHGNIKTQGYLQVRASAKITGDLECAIISVEKGAIINGKCSMGNAQETKDNHKED
jgi:cytoskeletal protein CcmA (bactofilin family)